MSFKCDLVLPRLVLMGFQLVGIKMNPDTIPKVKEKNEIKAIVIAKYTCCKQKGHVIHHI